MIGIIHFSCECGGRYIACGASPGEPFDAYLRRLVGCVFVCAWGIGSEGTIVKIICQFMFCAVCLSARKRAAVAGRRQGVAGDSYLGQLGQSFVDI